MLVGVYSDVNTALMQTVLRLYRKKINGFDYLNFKNIYEPFRNGDMVALKDRLSGKTMRKPIELNLKQRELLNKLAIKMLQ